MKYYLRMRRFLFLHVAALLVFFERSFCQDLQTETSTEKSRGGSAVKNNLPCIYPNVLNGAGQFTYKTG